MGTEDGNLTFLREDWKKLPWYGELTQETTENVSQTVDYEENSSI